MVHWPGPSGSRPQKPSTSWTRGQASTPVVPDGTAWDWLYLALAYQGTGKWREARQWLERATNWIREKSQQATDAPLPWYDQLELQLLRREAAMGFFKGWTL